MNIEECPFIPLVAQSFSSAVGTVETNRASYGREILYIYFFSIDNFFNLNINGTDVTTEFQFSLWHQAILLGFDTGFINGQNSVLQLWLMTGTTANPMIWVLIDADGNFQLS